LNPHFSLFLFIDLFFTFSWPSKQEKEPGFQAGKYQCVAHAFNTPLGALTDKMELSVLTEYTTTDMTFAALQARCQEIKVQVVAAEALLSAIRSQLEALKVTYTESINISHIEKLVEKRSLSILLDGWGTQGTKIGNEKASRMRSESKSGGSKKSQKDQLTKEAIQATPIFKLISTNLTRALLRCSSSRIGESAMPSRLYRDPSALENHLDRRVVLPTVDEILLPNKKQIPSVNIENFEFDTTSFAVSIEAIENEYKDSIASSGVKNEIQMPVPRILVPITDMSDTIMDLRNLAFKFETPWRKALEMPFSMVPGDVKGAKLNGIIALAAETPEHLLEIDIPEDIGEDVISKMKCDPVLGVMYNDVLQHVRQLQKKEHARQEAHTAAAAAASSVISEHDLSSSPANMKFFVVPSLEMVHNSVNNADSLDPVTPEAHESPITLCVWDFPYGQTSAEWDAESATKEHFKTAVKKATNLGMNSDSNSAVFCCSAELFAEFYPETEKEEIKCSTWKPKVMYWQRTGMFRHADGSLLHDVEPLVSHILSLICYFGMTRLLE
jgi:uncharacterized protein YsxB (DUF464 family)